MNLAYVAYQSVAREVRLAGHPCYKKEFEVKVSYWGAQEWNETRIRRWRWREYGTYLPNTTTSHPRMSQYCLNTCRTWNCFQILLICSVLNYSNLRLCHKKNRNCFQTVKRDTIYVLRKPNDVSVQLSDSSLGETFPKSKSDFLQNVTSIFKRTKHLLILQRNRISGMFP